MLPIWLGVETAIFQNFKLLEEKNNFLQIVTENCSKFKEISPFSKNKLLNFNALFRACIEINFIKNNLIEGLENVDCSLKFSVKSNQNSVILIRSWELASVKHP